MVQSAFVPAGNARRAAMRLFAGSLGDFRLRRDSQPVERCLSLLLA